MRVESWGPGIELAVVGGNVSLAGSASSSAWLPAPDASFQPDSLAKLADCGNREFTAAIAFFGHAFPGFGQNGDLCW